MDICFAWLSPVVEGGPMDSKALGSDASCESSTLTENLLKAVSSCCWGFCLTRGWLGAPVRIVRLWTSPSCESPTLTENLLKTAS